MEEVGRCQLYFPRGFIGVSPWLDHYTNPLVSCIRAREKWNGEGWTAIYTQFLGLREVSKVCSHLAAQSMLCAIAWHTSIQVTGPGAPLWDLSRTWNIPCPVSWMASEKFSFLRRRVISAKTTPDHREKAAILL